ncbi:hypothetical protein [Mycobacterium sp. HM-7]
MAAAFDVAGRLSEGDRALTVLDEYVAACQVLGLPSAASLPELYRAESGLDLAALSADARSLDAAVVAGHDALRLQGNGYRELASQWSGMGGDGAAGFLRTLTVAAEDVVAHLQRSAQALTTLRDELWRAVDTKVDAVLRADAQAAAHRDQWSAAARAVLGGAGDVAAASEIVDQQVKPFVLQVVSGDLVPTLEEASDVVAAAYGSAIATVTPAGVSFAVPFVMTPGWAPPAASFSAGPPAYQAAAAAPLGTLGNAASWAPSAPPAPATPPPPAEPVAAPSMGTSGVPEPALGAAAATPAAAGLAGDPGLGSTVGGLGQQLADAVGGALGSMAGLSPGASGLDGLDGIEDGTADSDDGVLDEDHEDEDHEDEDKAEDEADEEAEDEVEAEDESAGEVAAEAGDPAVAQPQADPEQPTPAPTPPPAPVSLPPEPVAGQENPTAKTPCEIAADELPQVGE